MIDCCLQNALSQVIRGATSVYTNNLLDVILTNSESLISDASIIIPFSNSDHRALEFSLQLSSCHRSLGQPRLRNFRKADYLKIINYLSNYNWQTFQKTL